MYSHGTIVHDTEDDTPDNLVVVEVPEANADDWFIGPPVEDTLANDNPDYPDDSDIVVGVFENDLEKLPSMDVPEDESATLEDVDPDDIPTSVDEIHNLDLPHYAFPVGRVEEADEEAIERVRCRKADFAAEKAQETSEGESEPQDDDADEETHTDNMAELEELAEALSDNGIRVTEIDEDEGVIHAKKVLNEYLITSTGEVEPVGDGGRDELVKAAVDKAL